MKILIVDDDCDIREIMMFTYDNEVDAEFLFAGDGKEAINKLESESDIDLIVCDYNMPVSNGGDVYTYLLEKKMNIPYVFCSSENIKDHHEFLDNHLVISEIKKPNVFEGVTNSITAYNKYVQTNKTDCDCIIRKTGNHCQVNLSILQACSRLPCDIYIKIGDEKLLKIFNAGEKLTSADIKKYEEKSLDYFLFEKSYMKDFLDEVSKKIYNIMDDRHKNESEKVLDIHAVILSTVKHLGFCDHIVKVTERSVKFVLGLIDNNNDYTELYHNIFGHEGKYLTKHSVALAYVTTALVSKLPWDSFDTKNKLVLASFFHDMVINNENIDETNSNDLISFKDHPSETVDKIKKMKGIPPDLDRIILDHHERPDGSGFPRGLSSTQIPALSALFIFAHDIVDIICKLGNSGKEISREKVKAELNLELYKAGTFKKCLDAFDSLVIFEADT